jgi:hypothetical protein
MEIPKFGLKLQKEATSLLANRKNLPSIPSEHLPSDSITPPTTEDRIVQPKLIVN